MNSLFFMVCSCACAVALAACSTVATDNGLGHFTWQRIEELQRDVPAARSMDFIILSGGPTVTRADHQQLTEHLARLGLSGNSEAQSVLARYWRLRGQSMPFRADPVQIPTPNGPRHVCILKQDAQSSYTLDTLFDYLRVERGNLEKAGIDLSWLKARRVEQHIIAHELWHCLEMVRPDAYYEFAVGLTFEDLGTGGVLGALLRNHGEVGADLFATLMDLRSYEGCQMVDFVIAVRAANLARRGDVEHYTVPAVSLLRQVSPASLAGLPLPRALEMVDELRRKGLNPGLFSATYHAVNRADGNGVK